VIEPMSESISSRELSSPVRSGVARRVPHAADRSLEVAICDLKAAACATTGFLGLGMNPQMRSLCATKRARENLRRRLSLRTKAVAQTPGGLTEAFLRVGLKKPQVVARPRRALLGLGAASTLSDRHSERSPGFRGRLVQQPRRGPSASRSTSDAFALRRTSKARTIMSWPPRYLQPQERSDLVGVAPVPRQNRCSPGEQLQTIVIAGRD
jgi:hypothetical protein